MQRLHGDDLVGHLLDRGFGNWKVLRFPAIAEEDEVHEIRTPFGGVRQVVRRAGEALHPEREPLDVLHEIRLTQGEYNFAGQYQRAPAPFGGGMVKSEWFKTFSLEESNLQFQTILQSWDTANKPGELSDSFFARRGELLENTYICCTYTARALSIRN
jgi:hypothetical protein